MGDLNAPNVAWGSGFNNKNEKYILEYIQNNNFIILNDGTATRVTRPQEKASVPDNTFCSVNMGADFGWHTLESR